MRSVRFIGPYQTMGPVPVDDAATIARGDFVDLSSGEAVAIAAGANANLGVALDKSPDSEYEEGDKSHIDVARLGEETEIEVAFTTSAGVTTAMLGAAAKRILADGTVDLDSVTDGAFIVRRLSRDTVIGDETGHVIGVVTDAASR